MKFDKHIRSSTTDVPVKLQSDTIIKTTNLAAPSFHDILRLLPGPRWESLVGINNGISNREMLHIYAAWHAAVEHYCRESI